MEKLIAFERITINVEKLPFQLLLNKNFVSDTTKKDFTWCWYVELQKFDDTEHDDVNLQTLMVEIIQKIMKVADIKIAGTTLYKNIYEIIFYAKEEDTSKIGGELSEMHHDLEDRKDRFLRNHSKRDIGWNNVKPYFHILMEN